MTEEALQAMIAQLHRHLVTILFCLLIQSSPLTDRDAIFGTGNGGLKQASVNRPHQMSEADGKGGFAGPMTSRETCILIT